MRRWKWLFLSLVPGAAALAAACGEDSPGIPDPAGDPDASLDARANDGSVDARVDAQDSGGGPGDGGADAEPDATIDSGVDAGPVLLFDTPANGAVGKRLWVRGGELFWQYDVGAGSVIAIGNVTGGQRVDIVQSATPIGVADVREVVVYQSGGKLLTRPASFAILAPIELTGSESCSAVTSTITDVYCRAKDDTIVRWPKGGGAATTIASFVAAGDEMVTDDTSLYLTETAGNISRIPAAGFAAGGPPVPPGYLLIAGGQNNPHDLAVGAPGDGVVYWSVDTPSGGRIRGHSKLTGVGAPDTAGPNLVGLDTFTHYSQKAGAYAALGDGGPASAIVFVRFGQVTPGSVQAYQASAAGVADMGTTSGAILWIDDLARVWRAAP